MYKSNLRAHDLLYKGGCSDIQVHTCRTECIYDKTYVATTIEITTTIEIIISIVVENKFQT